MQDCCLNNPSCISDERSSRPFFNPLDSSQLPSIRSWGKHPSDAPEKILPEPTKPHPEHPESSPIKPRFNFFLPSLLESKIIPFDALHPTIQDQIKVLLETKNTARVNLNSLLPLLLLQTVYSSTGLPANLKETSILSLSLIFITAHMHALFHTFRFKFNRNPHILLSESVIQNLKKSAAYPDVFTYLPDFKSQDLLKICSSFGMIYYLHTHVLTKKLSSVIDTLTLNNESPYAGSSYTEDLLKFNVAVIDNNGNLVLMMDPSDRNAKDESLLKHHFQKALWSWPIRRSRILLNPLRRKLKKGVLINSAAPQKASIATEG